MEKKWEKYLTECDRAHFATSGWGERLPFGLGERPAVIVADDDYSVLGLERQPLLESVHTWPFSSGLEVWDAIDRTVELLDAARQVLVSIVYLRGLDFPSPWGSRAIGEMLARLPVEVREGANAIVGEAASQSGDLVIQKPAPSGFQGTRLLSDLNYLSIDTVMVVGETTSRCVRATVVDGVTYRYQVGAVEECCFDCIEASHWTTFFDMEQKSADVINLEEAKGYFSKQLPTPDAGLASVESPVPVGAGAN